MCGIAGEVRRGGEPADVDAVARMADAMRVRGPDGSGAYARGGVAFAHRRLKIIDLSERGAQPMVDRDLGRAVVFNGCVYNYRALRRELEADGYRFVSESDTEVLLKGHHRWGDAFVERLDGMFAFALTETDSGRVLLGRDRLGIKPLYIAEVAGAVRFASTLPALLAGGGVDTAVDRVALHHYLSFHAIVPAPRTILAGVRKVAPATVVALEPDGTRRDTVYWRAAFARDPERAALGEDEWADAVLDALRAAVSSHMVADVPVGVLLSGGIDSSLVVALLAEAGQDGLRTFSVGFEDEGGESGDEFRWSDLVAERFATDHTQIRVPSSRLAPAVPLALAAMSEPMTSHDCVAFWLLSQEVAKSVTVVQSGQGADEILAGYDWYPPMLDAPGDGSATYRQAFADRDDAQVRRLLGPGWAVDGDVSTAFVEAAFSAPGTATPLDRALRLDTETMLVEDPVKRVDNMTMAASLEARVPFLDHRVVEVAAACPLDLKLAHGGKGVLKTAARALLPAEIIDRPKGYFPVPAIRHLDGPILELVRGALHAPAARERALFAPATVKRLLADPNRDRSQVGPNTLWQVGLLELWLQTNGL